MLTVGECLGAMHAADPVAVSDALHLSVAGSESNVAIALARLGHRVHHVGRVGDDAFGQRVARTLRAEGVGDRLLVDPAGPTGTILFERRGAATRVEYRRAGSAGARLTTQDVAAAVATDDPQLVHLSGITAALGPDGAAVAAWLAEAAREGRVTLSFDVNYRRGLWSTGAAAALLRPVAEAATVVFGSDDELALLHPDAPALVAVDEAALVAGEITAPDVVQRVIEWLLAGGAREVVRKLGPAGAEVRTGDGALHVPAVPVPVVDVVGAGDALAAGYLSGRLDGLDPAACLRRGVRTAAAVVASRGDWEHLPTRRDLDLAPGGTIR